MKTEQQERKVSEAQAEVQKPDRGSLKKQKLKEKKLLKTTFTVNSFDGLFINA